MKTYVCRVRTYLAGGRGDRPPYLLTKALSLSKRARHKNNTRASRRRQNNALQTDLVVVVKLCFLFFFSQTEDAPRLATVSACTGRTARPVSSRFRVPRRLEPRHLRVLRELNTLDLELVAWLQRTKPTSDEWTCLVSRNLPETRDPRDRDSPST